MLTGLRGLVCNRESSMFGRAGDLKTATHNEKRVGDCV